MSQPTPAKLTDTQLLNLSRAAQRDDHAIDLPPNLKGGAATKTAAPDHVEARDSWCPGANSTGCHQDSDILRDRPPELPTPVLSEPSRRPGSRPHVAVHGHDATLVADLGVAGLWRLLRLLEELRGFPIVMAVASMEGALFGVRSGLVESPAGYRIGSQIACLRRRHHSPDERTNNSSFSICRC